MKTEEEICECGHSKFDHIPFIDNDWSCGWYSIDEKGNKMEDCPCMKFVAQNICETCREINGDNCYGNKCVCRCHGQELAE